MENGVSPLDQMSPLQYWDTRLGIRSDWRGAGEVGHFDALVKSNFDALILAFGTSDINVDY